MSYGEQGNPCTDKQAAVLEKHGYDSNVTFDEASHIIDQLAANGWKRPAAGQPAQTTPRPPQQRPTGGGNGYQPAQQQRPPQQRAPQQSPSPCTPKQAAVLQKHGYAANVTFDEASAIIDELAANGWQRPDGGDSGGGQYANAPYQPQVQGFNGGY